jgi:hypothetical protein
LSLHKNERSYAIYVFSVEFDSVAGLYRLLKHCAGDAERDRHRSHFYSFALKGAVVEFDASALLVNRLDDTFIHAPFFGALVFAEAVSSPSFCVSIPLLTGPA